MIIVDGQEYSKDVQQFATLEELLSAVASDAGMQGRTVTDVFVNNEIFSEIYPNQAEDIATTMLSSVEVKSVPDKQLALDIVGELDKVCRIMMSGARGVARLFRRGDDANALDVLQDMLDVTRDFMAMQHSLRAQYGLDATPNVAKQIQQLDDLLTEMSDVMANEDWILLADLLEYEFQPQCEAWQEVIAVLQAQMRSIVKQ